VRTLQQATEHVGTGDDAQEVGRAGLLDQKGACEDRVPGNQPGEQAGDGDAVHRRAAPVGLVGERRQRRTRRQIGVHDLAPRDLKHEPAVRRPQDPARLRVERGEVAAVEMGTGGERPQGGLRLAEQPVDGQGQRAGRLQQVAFDIVAVALIG
jgi:hypothetical protein